MKWLVSLLLLVLCSSCAFSAKGPWTKTEYSMGIERERGLYLQAVPPYWEKACDTSEKLFKKIN